MNWSRLLMPQRGQNFLVASTYRQQDLATTYIRQLASFKHVNHLHFHINSSSEKEKTGLLLLKNSNLYVQSISSFSYLKSNSFHSNNLLYTRCSNFAVQKVNIKSDAKSLKEDGKNDECLKQLDESQQKEKPLTLVGKFKKMAKEYWYVLIPVHAVTSLGWFCGFYYASVNGVDIVGIMENLHISETIISKLRDSSLGHWAIAYILYKIATPARYTVTLGGTTYAINILSSKGIIKPLPSRTELVQMYKDKREDIQQKIEDRKQVVADKKEELFQKFEDKKQEIGEKIKRSN